MSDQGEPQPLLLESHLSQERVIASKDKLVRPVTQDTTAQTRAEIAAERVRRAAARSGWLGLT